MNSAWEFIFGLDHGFLNKEGEFSLQFNPHWPFQHYVGSASWNILLALLAFLLVVYVYRRDAQSHRPRIALGAFRLTLLALILTLLNRPVLMLTQTRTEPSVLAVLVDDSLSMKVRDGGIGPDKQPQTRLQSAVNLLTADNQALLKSLAKEHTLRFYKFDTDAQPLGSAAPDQLQLIQPDGQHTQVLRAVRTVLDDLQGQRLAGILLLTDGRESPAQRSAEALAAIKDFGIKILSVPLGSDQPPGNIEIQSVNVQDAAFQGDIVNVKATVRATGYPPNHPVELQLKDKKTGTLLTTQKTTLPDDKPLEVELQFKPDRVGSMDLVVEAVKQAGELDDEDNLRTAQISVMDARIAVLYVDGYPRWEYRYVKNEMIRDKSVEISCLLTSADPNFAQEGDRPIKRFPESIQELMDYDVVVFGDVDPRQFTDNQLQLVSDFVSKKGGGFGIVAGPRWSPQAYRNTAIEPILPVAVRQVEADDPNAVITQGFRPVLTRDGANSSIFRFLADKPANELFLKDKIPELFWYCRGVTVKPGVGEIYAEHPNDIAPDGRKAPILVLGRFGAGRTLFSAIDDSWRWRFYTGESVFDTYWVQQLRYLARGKKLGQRRLTFTSFRPSYELGEQIRLNLRVLDSQLLQQLPDQIRVEIIDPAGQITRQENLLRQEGQSDLYVASWTADRVGRWTARLAPIASGVDSFDLPVEVIDPRLELSDPKVDRNLLASLGALVPFENARAQLPQLLPSAARQFPVETSQPLWDAPLAMLLFVLLISAEWIVRKMYGML